MLWVAGYVFATHAPITERRIVKRCSMAGLLGCIAYNAAWYPPYPQLILGVPSTTYFSFISVIVGGYCAEKAIDREWGLPLFTLFILDICCHIARAFNEIEFYPYSIMVDLVGYAQILIFIALGGKGVRDRLFNTSSLLRNGLGSGKTAREN
jgi:hypothetical protein